MSLRNNFSYVSEDRQEAERGRLDKMLIKLYNSLGDYIEDQ